MQNPPSPRFRPDFRRRQRAHGDDRAAERVLAHYVLERALSDRLRRAPREARASVYAEVYTELFAALPDHPQHRVRGDMARRVAAQLHRVAGKLHAGDVFLELGCGDAALGFALAQRVQAVYGLDVTSALIDFDAAPPNFHFLQTDGVTIPLATEAVDFAYSDQLMEHLHPDDAATQLSEIYRVLKPGGRYMCITPSRVTGPHDVSGYFDYEASCLHLKEYDYGMLVALFHQAGFRRLSCYAPVRGRELTLPYFALRAAERCLLFLSPPLRATLARFGPVQAVLGLTVVAAK